MKRNLTPKTEYKFKTEGGYKNTRYADVVALDSRNNVVEVHQVGKVTKKKKMPVARERKAIRDIRKFSEEAKDGKLGKIYFHEY